MNIKYKNATFRRRKNKHRGTAFNIAYHRHLHPPQSYCSTEQPVVRQGRQEQLMAQHSQSFNFNINFCSKKWNNIRHEAMNEVCSETKQKSPSNNSSIQCAVYVILGRKTEKSKTETYRQTIGGMDLPRQVPEKNSKKATKLQVGVEASHTKSRHQASYSLCGFQGKQLLTKKNKAVRLQPLFCHFEHFFSVSLNFELNFS